MRTVNFTHKRGDTFYQTPINIKVNDVDLDLTGAVILMQLRKEAGGVIALTPDLTITDAVGGDFQIDEQIINIPACTYQYDIQITLADDTVVTWISGLFIINDDISR
jgi:hypothetical protein